jgi:hypothetical protein
LSPKLWNCGIGLHGSNLKVLTQKQKQASRLITKSNYNSHTEPLLKKNKIQPLNDLIDFNNLKIMFEYEHKLLPSSFNKMWITNGERRDANSNNTGNVALRNDDMSYLPLSRTNVCQRLPLTNIARV